MSTNSERRVRVYFRDVGHKPMLVPVDENYEIKIEGEWLILPAARVAASEILTVQIVNETRELKAA